MCLLARPGVSDRFWGGRRRTTLIASGPIRLQEAIVRVGREEIACSQSIGFLKMCHARAFTVYHLLGRRVRAGE
jgi:hypothetical protein